MNKKPLKVIGCALAFVFAVCLAGAYVLVFVYPAWMNEQFETPEHFEPPVPDVGRV